MSPIIFYQPIGIAFYQQVGKTDLKSFRKILANRPESELGTKNMSEPVYLKTSCGSCDGHIEYPADCAGTKVACPHCSKEVYLAYQSAPARQNSTPAPRLQHESSAERPDLSGVSRMEFEVRQAIQNSFMADPSMKLSVINSFSMVNEFGNKYRGLLEFQTGNKFQVADVEVTHDGHNFIWKIGKVSKQKRVEPPKPTIKGNTESDIGQVFGLIVMAGILYLRVHYMNLDLKEPLALLTFVAMVLAGLALYLFPSYLAYKREHKDLVAIVALNVLGGWTFVGWVFAIVWALKVEE